MNIDGYAFIVGGGGIGRACALAFAKQGAARVMVADLSLDVATKVAAEAKEVAKNTDFRAEACEIDVTVEDSVRGATKKTTPGLGNGLV